MKRQKNINSILVIIFTMVAFMVFLNTYSFKGKVESVTVQSDSVIMNGIKKKIEYSMSNGKNAVNYYGIDDLVNNFHNSYKDCDGLIFIDDNNNLIYSTYENDAINSYLEGLSKIDRSDENTYNHVFYKGYLISSIDIYDYEENNVATLYNIVNNSHNHRLITNYLNRSILIFIVCSLILILVFSILMKKLDKKSLNNKTIVIGLLIFQIVTMTLSFSVYESSIKDNINYSINNMSNSIASNFSKIIDNNIDTDDLSGFDEYLNYVKDSISAIDDYYIEKTYDENNNVNYKFLYTISNKYINDILKNNLIDAVTIFIISIFFFLEISNVYNSLEKNDVEAMGGLSTKKIRAQAFFLFIAYNLSVYFVPIQMMNIIKFTSTTTNLDILVGIPTSIEALMIALSSIISGVFIDKFGSKKMYITGNIVLILGFLLSYISHNTYMFIASRAVCGIGYGICLLTVRTYAACCNGNQISEVIAGINASAYASVNIGSIAGGYIGEFFGIKYTFMASVVMCIVGYVFCEFKMINISYQYTEKLKVKQIFKGFIKEKGFILSVVMVLLPISICIAFIDYFYPLYASDKLVFKLTDISKGYLLNGLIIVLLGVSINKFVSRLFSLKLRFISASLLLGFAIALFGLTTNAIGMYATIVIISLAMTYISGSYIEYYMSFDIVKKIGLSKSMSFYTLFDKIGAYLAPLIYGVILLKDIKVSLLILAIYTIVSINIFNIITKK